MPAAWGLGQGGIALIGSSPSLFTAWRSAGPVGSDWAGTGQFNITEGTT